MAYFCCSLGISYRQSARFWRADRGAGFCFFLRSESLRWRLRRRVCCAVEGSVGFRWRGRVLIFSRKIREAVSGEWARERRERAMVEGSLVAIFKKVSSWWFRSRAYYFGGEL